LPVAPEGEGFVAASELAALKARQTASEDELASLRMLVDRLYAELDIKRS